MTQMNEKFPFQYLFIIIRPKCFVVLKGIYVKLVMFVRVMKENLVLKQT